MMRDVEGIVAELEQITLEVSEKFGGLSSSRLNWKPSAKSWSIGQCLEHLIITNELYFPAIQRVIDGQHKNNIYSKIPFATDLISALMKNSLNPYQKRKMKTFQIFQPSSSKVSPNIVSDLVSNQEILIGLANSVRGLDIHNIKISEPISPTLNLRLDNAFEILAMHERRHILQAERVISSSQFSKMQ